MNHTLKNVRRALSGLSLSALLVFAATGSVLAAPSSAPRPTPPKTSFSTGPQDKPVIEPGTRDAKLTPKLGPTQELKVEADGKLKADAVTPMAGTVANVDLLNTLNYCSNNLLYVPVQNTTSVSKYVQVRVYNQNGYREAYATVAANSTSYVAFYGVTGSYYAYLYTWNGSTYQYDEYKSGTHTCNVSVTRVYNSGGWVQLKIQNLGTAYASQRSAELAPFTASDTYTGTHYDYPAAGGAAIYRWFWVGTSPYGIVSDTLGSSNYPVFFTGDL